MTALVDTHAHLHDAAFDDADATVALTGVPPGSVLSLITVNRPDAVLDADGDSLNDHWEAAFGLDTLPGSGAAGTGGAAGDPDGDGLTNLEEFLAGSSPTGTHARFLAEGSAGSFFTTRVALANPGDVQANVAVRFELETLLPAVAPPAPRAQAPDVPVASLYRRT